ncbi:MAG TPA: vWA domain-containing protein [Polyangiaceae bacterium]|nr:vWA domain-containing protein [Polyangiaceae bacterium]
MRSLRLASTFVMLGVAAGALNASCSSKSDTSLGSGATSGTGGSGGTGGGTITLTGGSGGLGGTTGGTGASSNGGADTAGAGDDGVPACTTLGGLESCGGTSVEAKLRTVNMLLVIDKSGSMTDPLGDTDKWTAMKSAIGTALGHVADQMNFGLVLFPYAVFHTIPVDGCDTDCCELPDGDAAVLVPVAQGTRAVEDIGYQLDATSPGGGTPTAGALDAALQYFTTGDGAALDGEKYVLLATDGGPNCNDKLTCTADTCTTNLDGQCPEGNCCQDPDQHDLCLDDQAVLSELKKLGQAGIPTFVVGLPGTQQYSSYLDEFAQADALEGTNGDAHYYAVSESDGVNGLIDAFDSITTELVRSCTIDLTEPPTKLDLVNVAIDCNVVPQDSSDGSGWDFDMTPNPTAVVLRGPVCDQLQANGAMRVDVLYGCPTVR